MKRATAVLAILFLFVGIGTARAVPVAAPTANATGIGVTWLNITLGEPEAAVLSRLGEAGFHASRPNGQSLIFYAVTDPHGNDGGEGLVFRSGRVTAIQVIRTNSNGDAPTFADPYGITLATVMDSMESSRGKPQTESDTHRWRTLEYRDVSGARSAYRFNNGKMESMKLSLPNSVAIALPALTMPAQHNGSSFKDALIDGATDEDSGAMNEEWYLRGLRCNHSRDRWREVQQALVFHNKRPYDVLHLACYRGPETRDLYFDISSFFGKL